MIQVNPLDSNSNFECLSCKSKESSERIETLVQDYSGKDGQTLPLQNKGKKCSLLVLYKKNCLFVMFQMMLFKKNVEKHLPRLIKQGQTYSQTW
jgi:hypothetical protein